MNTPSFEMNKRELWIKTGIKILICLLLAIMYLDGEHYPQCMCIFPDEILDLPCSFSPYQIEGKKVIFSEDIHNQGFVSFVEFQIFSMSGVFNIKKDSLIDSLISQGFKKRLFFLQHYNS